MPAQNRIWILWLSWRCNEINTHGNLEIVQWRFNDPKPTDRCNKTVTFWYPLSLLLILLSFSSWINVIYICFMWASHSVYVFSLPYCHILLISVFLFCFLFHVLCWLTGPCFACLLSCPSLKVARQSAEPWASKSTKVKLTHLPTTTCPPPSSPKDSLPHCSPTSRHHSHSVVQMRGTLGGREWASSTQHCSGGFSR